MPDERYKPDRRPTRQEVKISKERIDAILKDISEGSTYFHASEANGIAYVTFYHWVRQGQVDIRHEIESLHSYLVKALRKIEQSEIKDCKKKVKSLKKGHKGAQWILERVYWKQFSTNAEALILAEEIELEKGASSDEVPAKGSKPTEEETETKEKKE